MAYHAGHRPAGGHQLGYGVESVCMFGAGRHPDLVNRKFEGDGDNLLWVTDPDLRPDLGRSRVRLLHHRRFQWMIVGWRVASNMPTTMVLDAIDTSNRG